MARKPELLFFLSCSPDSSEYIEKCCDDERISSVYRVCGVHPWLIILKPTPSMDTVFKHDIRSSLRIKHVSLVRKLPAAPNKRAKHHLTVSWVFLKGSPEHFKTLIDAAGRLLASTISEYYEAFGEYEFLVRLHTDDINGVDGFLTLCREHQMTTSTKFVLRAVKEAGQKLRLDPGHQDQDKDALEARRQADYAVARIMATTPDFPRKSAADQQALLREVLPTIGATVSEIDISRYVLDPDPTASEYSPNDLEHPNHLVDRYSADLTPVGWLRALVFFKGKGTEKDRLEKALQEELLGVTATTFAKKLYHMTGDNDFMVPLSCLNLGVLNSVVETIVKGHPDLIESCYNTVCKSPVGKSKPLQPLEVPVVEALLLNSTCISQFEARIRDRTIFESMLEGKLPAIAEEGIAPREDYVRHKIGDILRDKATEKTKENFAEYFRGGRSFSDIGIQSTVEFKDGAMTQVLAKFFFANVVAKGNFVEDLEKKLQQYEVVAIRYEPVRDPLTYFLLVMVSKLVELEVLLRHLGKHCNKVEFHVIFHQRYYSKLLERNLRCRPCFYPREPRPGCSMASCDQCSEEARRLCVPPACATCVKYILARKPEKVLTIPFGSPTSDRCNRRVITLVGIDLSFAQYLALNERFDTKGFRTTVLARYAQAAQELQAHGKSVRETAEQAALAYDAIVDRDVYRGKYVRAVTELLKRCADADIVVLPEYAIPLNVFSALMDYDYKKACIVVAGSHVDKDGFNVCPIIIVCPGVAPSGFRKTMYSYYKNHPNPFESSLKLVANTGLGYLKFLDTPYGNIYPQLCYDVYRRDADTEIKEVDILLVPACNFSKVFTDNLNTLAKQHKLVAVYANTSSDAEVASRFFVPPNQGREASLLGVRSLHKWSGRESSAKNIFELSEPTKLTLDGFEFVAQSMCVDLMGLDKRRGLPNSVRVGGA